jgi:hypothetical protein
MKKDAQHPHEVMPVQTCMFYYPFPLFLTNGVRFQEEPEAIHYRRTVRVLVKCAEYGPAKAHNR